MERIKNPEKQKHGFIVEKYENVEPEELNNFRMQAAAYLLERPFNDEELAQINAKEKTVMVDLEFKEGLQFTRMNFASGAIIELYRNGKERFRLIYDPNAKIVKTQREPRN